MEWPKNDREAEERHEALVNHCFEEDQNERREAAKRVRRIQEKKQKGKGLGQEFDVKDEFFD